MRYFFRFGKDSLKKSLKLCLLIFCIFFTMELFIAFLDIPIPLTGKIKHFILTNKIFIFSYMKIIGIFLKLMLAKIILEFIYLLFMKLDCIKNLLDEFLEQNKRPN